jgi:octanoyl-[GcvH]:protein N-octanoyltransferase
MKDHDLTSLRNILLLDRTQDLSETDVLYPFALDELLCRQTGKGGPAICHLWRHPHAFVLGLRDSRLPQAKEALHWLASLGRSTAVRNTGGAGVPLDPGVINISLILPKTAGDDRHFHQDFEQMYTLIREALRETGYTIEKGEIQGAFCPGDYDLSIAGRKFCGIAQRRQAKAYIVQAFVIAEGSGRERAKLAREFYERAAIGAAQPDYPIVEEQSTASIEELTHIGPHAAQAFIDAIKRVIREQQSRDEADRVLPNGIIPTSEEIHVMAATLRQRYGIS